jgi:cytochrome c oxidase assembly protein subunit 15
MMSSRAQLWLHRFAIALAGATLALIFVGGLVTSTGSGLAVPDWPLSFGRFFPPMVGGVFYEHGHRLVAASVGFLTVLFALTARLVAAPASVRRLALVAVGVVVAQGVLGGMTVLLLLPTAVSVAHACLAQAFLCLTVALAVITAPAWRDARVAHADARSRLATLAAIAAATTYAQLVLGAVVRHSGAGLAIADFPLAFGRLVPPFDAPGVAIHFAHRVGALVVTALVAATAGAALARHRHDPALVRPAVLATALVAAQLSLGALTIWTRKAVLPTTLHVVVGAALLATMIVLALRARRAAPASRRVHAPLLARQQVPA